MIRTLFPAVPLVILSCTCLAQNKTQFDHNFNSLESHLYVYSGKGITTTYANGKCVIKNTSGYLSYLQKSLCLDFRKDFSLEFTFSFLKNLNPSDNLYCTLSLSHDIETDVLNFSLYEENAVKIDGLKDGKILLYKPYSLLSLNRLPTSNTMKIEKKGTLFTFYVNDLVVLIKNNVHFPGNILDINFNNHSEIAIDRLVLFQENSGIKLPENLNLSQIKEQLPPEFKIKKGTTSIHISPDGTAIYGNVPDERNPTLDERYGCDDIWISEKMSGGQWTEMKKMPYPISTEKSNDIVSISPDHNTLFMSDTNCYPSNYSNVWVSHRTESGWSKPKAMRVKNGYNKSIYSSARIASNGKYMIVSYRREDSWGKSDIYVCTRLNDSTWSEPQNIGHAVNSLGREFPCHLAPDDKTLYFASDGHNGYGEVDLYVTHRLDDTWTNWSEPENLGPNINGKGWDAYYCTDATGEYAYFASDDNDRLPEAKFFRIKIPKEIKSDPVVVVKGKVLNIKTKSPVAAEIFYELLPEGKEAGLARSNPDNGSYLILLPYGKQYGYRAEAKGYITVNENFDLTEDKEYIELERNLYLVPIEVGQKITLNNVFFQQSKAELLPSSYPELNRLAQIMKDNPGIEIELQGHTDNQGDAKLNQLLSENRVTTVRNYLINRGIAATRIKGKGFGGSVPVASNDVEENRKLNRRVEFAITKQ